MGFNSVFKGLINKTNICSANGFDILKTQLEIQSGFFCVERMGVGGGICCI